MKLALLGNENYAAKFFKIEKLNNHANADKLQLVVIDFRNVITDLDAKVGDIYVYFPLECSINSDYLKWSNSFENRTQNADPQKKGFFNKHGRVRAIKLRGVPSEGYIIPAKHLEEWMIKCGIIDKALDYEDYLDKDFDHINGVEICKKYVIKTKKKGNSNSKNPNKKVKKVSRIIDGQFRLSEDTAQLKKNIYKIAPDDFITITYKIHGTNIALGNCLVKRKLSLKEQISKLFGAKINDTEYDIIHASRRVIKANKYIEYFDLKTKLLSLFGKNNQNHTHYYDEDVWTVIAQRYKDCLEQGITIHGEVAGQQSNGSWIQKEYDYGLPENTFDLWVYRIFYTKPNGELIEFSTDQIERYCQKYGLKMVPVLYRGRAKDLYPYLDTKNHWHENFLENLIKDYNEADCYMCKNKVPEEGIVLTKEDYQFEPLKLKSQRFYERETKELDEGLTNIESEEENFVDNEEN